MRLHSSDEPSDFRWRCWVRHRGRPMLPSDRRACVCCVFWLKNNVVRLVEAASPPQTDGSARFVHFNMVAAYLVGLLCSTTKSVNWKKKDDFD